MYRVKKYMTANHKTLLKLVSASVVFAKVAFVCGLAITAISVQSVQASSITESARTQVEKTIAEIKRHVAAHPSKTATEEANAKLRELLMPIFDFEDMSRSSLGANWRKGSEEQQKEFVAVFSDLLARTYLDKIRENIEGSEIQYLPPMTKADRVVIRTKVVTGADIIAIDYRMYQKAGAWKIYDVLVENVGLVSNYRNEFAAILRKEDFSGLLTRLRAQAASNRTDSAQL